MCGVLSTKQGSLQEVLSIRGSDTGEVGVLGHQLLVPLTARCLSPLGDFPWASGSQACPLWAASL